MVVDMAALIWGCVVGIGVVVLVDVELGALVDEVVEVFIFATELGSGRCSWGVRGLAM